MATPSSEHFPLSMLKPSSPNNLHETASTAELTTSTLSPFNDLPLPISPSSSAPTSTNEYNLETLNHFLLQEAKCPVSKCLANHAITQCLRAKMVDWMIEVTHKADCSPATLHYSVKLMDRFFKNTNEPLKGSDLHLIGVVSMMLASKLEDVAVMDAGFMFDHVVHKKISLEKIRDYEYKMLKTLEFWVTAPTELDFLSVLIPLLGIAEDFIKKVKFAAMANLFSYEFCEMPASLLAAGSILYVLKDSSFEPLLSRFCRTSEDEIRKAGEKVRDHVATFTEQHQNVKRVFEYNELLAE